MKRWLVYSPQYQTYNATDMDPPEYGADVVEVETETRRDALMLGVAEMMKDWDSYAHDNRENDLPPWAGIKAEEVCAHDCHDKHAEADVTESSCHCCAIGHGDDE